MPDVTLRRGVGTTQEREQEQIQEHVQVQEQVADGDAKELFSSGQRGAESTEASMSAEDAEVRMRRKEDALADSNAPLLSEGDYEREVITTPNSSIAWIKYIAFQLSIGEVEKARQVVHKGLETISFREEGEKLNVWIASLNLEKIHGTKDSLMKVFERAVLYNDPKEVYTKMVEIHSNAGDFKMVDGKFTCRFRCAHRTATCFSL